MPPDSEPTRGKEEGNPDEPWIPNKKAIAMINAINEPILIKRLEAELTRLTSERDKFQKVVVERDAEIAGLKAQMAIKAIENICEQCGGDKVAEVGCIECEQGRWQEAIYTLLVNHAPDDKIDGAGSDSGDPLDFALAEIQQALGYIEDERESLKAELSALKKRDEWVDVRERLPVISKIVHRRILIWDELSVREGWFNGDRFQEWDAHGIPENISGVTHWRSLPEPPKRDLTEKTQ